MKMRRDHPARQPLPPIWYRGRGRTLPAIARRLSGEYGGVFGNGFGFPAVGCGLKVWKTEDADAKA